MARRDGYSDVRFSIHKELARVNRNWSSSWPKSSATPRPPRWMKYCG